MSDPGSWQAPTSQPPTWQPPSAPQYGERLPSPPPFQPQHPQQFPYPPAPTGWTPPPKPGLIPLRPLSLGDILGGAFQVLRRNPKPTFGFALVMSLISTFVVGIVSGVVMVFAIERVMSAPAHWCAVCE